MKKELDMKEKLVPVKAKTLCRDRNGEKGLSEMGLCSAKAAGAGEQGFPNCFPPRMNCLQTYGVTPDLWISLSTWVK